MNKNPAVADDDFAAEIAQAENRRAIRNNRHKVRLRRAVVHGGRLLCDGLHRLRHTGSVGQAEILFRLQFLRETHPHLAALVVGEHLIARERCHR